MRAIASVLCLLFLASFSLAEKGLDISNYNGVVPQSTYSNFMNQGYDFSVVQAWQENHANTNFQQNYNNAIGAGMDHVDAYAFVCNTCHGGTTPSQVVSSLQSTLPSGYSGTVWLDVEQCSGCWTSSGTQNQQFVSNIASQLQSQGYNVGIYSNKNMWNEVMGSDAGNTDLDNLPLWYAHYDSKASFNDPSIYKFAGWTDPEFKQYQGSVKLDGQDVDLDYGSKVSNDIEPKSKQSTKPDSSKDASKDASKPASSKADSSKEDKSKSDASKADSSKAASSKADSSKSAASKADSSKAASSKAASSKAASSKASSDKSATHSSKVSSKAASSKTGSSPSSFKFTGEDNSKAASKTGEASHPSTFSFTGESHNSNTNSQQNGEQTNASSATFSGENENSNTNSQNGEGSNASSATFSGENDQSSSNNGSTSEESSQASSDTFSGESDSGNGFLYADY